MGNTANAKETFIDPACYQLALGTEDAIAVEMPNPGALRHEGVTAPVVELIMAEGDNETRVWVTLEQLESVLIQARRIAARAVSGTAVAA